MKLDDMKTIKDLGRQIYPFNQILWDKYKIQNLLGKILMKVRDIYMKDGDITYEF
jgi:predicted NAD-dependent protein-ADP-ribosyltransferase YbiA (DUF1768 family)